MPVSDKELESMVKNLKQAFADASNSYEQGLRYYGSGSEPTRQRGLELAAISEAYLHAVREQDERKAEQEARTLPGKSLKSAKPA